MACAAMTSEAVSVARHVVRRRLRRERGPDAASTAPSASPLSLPSRTSRASFCAKISFTRLSFVSVTSMKMVFTRVFVFDVAESDASLRG